MLEIHHQVVTDEAFRPVAVVIPYTEWLTIEKLLAQPVEPTMNLNDLAGTLSDDGADPVVYQRQMRDEWP